MRTIRCGYDGPGNPIVRSHTYIKASPYPSLSLPFTATMKIAPGFRAFAVLRLLVRRHQSTAELPWPRLLTTRLEPAVTLPIIEHSAKPVRRLDWIGWITLNLGEQLRQGLGNLGATRGVGSGPGRAPLFRGELCTRAK